MTRKAIITLDADMIGRVTQDPADFAERVRSAVLGRRREIFCANAFMGKVEWVGPQQEMPAVKNLKPIINKLYVALDAHRDHLRNLESMRHLVMGDQVKMHEQMIKMTQTQVAFFAGLIDDLTEN